MDPIRLSYDDETAIPEAFRPLYEQQGETWVLTHVDGLKTAGDVAKVRTTLEAERKAHKTTKAELNAWKDLGEREDVAARLDRVVELETAAGGKLDAAGIEGLVEKRLEKKVAAATAPLQRDIEKLKKQNEDLTARSGELGAKLNRYDMQGSLREALVELKVLPEHHEDVFMYAEKYLERTEDGFQVRQGANGIAAGLGPKDWLSEMVQRKPGWVPGSRGAGARGSSGGSGAGSDNPWSKDGWNMTKQGQIFRQDPQRAAQLAAAAGSKVGAVKPS